jgi:methylation protein EvaC
VCGGTDLVPILDLGEHPVPNRYPDPGLSWPLQLVWCQACLLAQTSIVVPDAVLYGADYAFRTGTSSAPHMHNLAREISRRWPGAFVVEVGCNDATLLTALAARGHPVAGVDPSTPAGVEHVKVWREPLTAAVAGGVVGELGPADVVVATNVLAHVAHAHALVEAASKLLAPRGHLVAEVQYWPDLLTGGAFDCCYHEHRYHWTLTGLHRLLSAYGLRLNRVEQIAPHGGSIRITASRQGLPGTDVLALLAAESRWWGRQPPMVAPAADRIRHRLYDLLGRCGSVDALGASAKLVTLIAWCNLAEDIGRVLDQTPAKQGHMLPGTSIPVVDPGSVDPSRVLLLGAWSYLPQILRGDPGYFDGPRFTAGGGRLLVPLPTPTLI